MQILARILIPAAFLACLASPARAQASVYLEAGVAIPGGRLGAIASPGPLVAGGVAMRGSEPGLGMGAHVSYARMQHSSGDARSDVMGVTAWTSYAVRPLEALELEPWIGAGALTHARQSSDYPGLDTTRGGFTAELGVRASTPVGRVRVFVSGRYVWGVGKLRTPFPSDFAGTALGLMLPLGG